MQNTLKNNEITFTAYNSSKYILHTNEGKHYLVNADKKEEIEKILNSSDLSYKKEFIEKIKSIKSTIKNKHLFLTDFQFRRAIISEKNMHNVVKPFEFFFNKYFFILFALIIVIILPIVYFHINYFGIQNRINMSYTTVIFTFIFVFHEIGHSTACLKYNAKPGEIGFGIISYMPVLYADVSDAWRLKRKERMMVNFGGIYFQNIISIILLIASVSINNVSIYLIAKAIFVLSLYQLFPFYKSDGYWILSDIISEPNLFRNARKNFYKKLTNPFSKIGTKNSLIIIYYIMITSIILSFVIKMGIRYYDYIIGLPKYLLYLLKKVNQFNFSAIEFDIKYLWASIYIFFITRMIFSNIRELILSKRG